MRRITVTENVSLDGVMQAPASPDEDTRGEFPYGGWAVPGSDEALAAEMAVGMGSDGAMLFGHRTYRSMAAFWPHQTDGNPYSEYLNRVEKFVVSRNAATRLEWENSTLVAGDAIKTVATRGFALDLENSQPGLHCVAIPWREGGEVRASVGLSGPSTRLSSQALTDMAWMMMKEVERA